MFQSNFPRKIVFGEGSLEFLTTLDVRRVVLFVDEIFHQYNPKVISRIEEIWKEKKTDFWLYYGEGTEPTLAFVKESAKKLQEHQPDLIVAVGGGSVLDAAKVMEVYYEHPEISDAALMNRFNLPPLRRKSKFVAIPTTSGTGSEVTPISVLYVPSDNPQSPMVKKGITDYQMIPDYVILDPQFTLSMPESVTISTGLDAFVHSLEAFVCNKPKNDFGDKFALESMKKVLTYLPKVLESPQNKAYRAELQLAATMGGLALANRASGAAHGSGKQLSSLRTIAHGTSVAIMVDAVIRCNAKVRLADYAEIARYLGVHAETDEEALEGLLSLWNGLLDTLDFPRTIADLGIDEKIFQEKLDTITRNAMNDAAMKANPIALTYDEVQGLFKSLLP
jgi:alcohol dehydrogenase class IV